MREIYSPQSVRMYKQAEEIFLQPSKEFNSFPCIPLKHILSGGSQIGFLFSNEEVLPTVPKLAKGFYFWATNPKLDMGELRSITDENKEAKLITMKWMLSSVSDFVPSPEKKVGGDAHGRGVLEELEADGTLDTSYPVVTKGLIYKQLDLELSKKEEGNSSFWTSGEILLWGGLALDCFLKFGSQHKCQWRRDCVPNLPITPPVNPCAALVARTQINSPTFLRIVPTLSSNITLNNGQMPSNSTSSRNGLGES